jgi:hypothetical protein
LGPGYPDETQGKSADHSSVVYSNPHGSAFEPVDDRGHVISNKGVVEAFPCRAAGFGDLAWGKWRDDDLVDYVDHSIARPKVGRLADEKKGKKRGDVRSGEKVPDDSLGIEPVLDIVVVILRRRLLGCVDLDELSLGDLRT